jgi:hypothetical protein
MRLAVKELLLSDRALDEIARSFLARHRVRGEPVTWQPPVSLLDDLDLPGPDPSLIDIARLHELVREGEHSAQRAAEVLGTTIDAVRVVLDKHPAPAAPLTTAQARATGKVRHAARQVLAKKEFRRGYLTSTSRCMRSRSRPASPGRP